MEVIETVIKTPKEATELGLALAEIIVKVKQMAANGLGSDDIAAAVALITSQKIVAGVQGLEKLGGELKENKTAFVAAFVVAALTASEQL